ncbi:MAG TPA: prenyltransferase [Deltaproteobacteria bacterium]|mgnify:CR=1 FL=1|nr:prenyltransferase [Deltaproteobacteria bacterium]
MTGIAHIPDTYRTAIRAWIMMARIPFHSVGVLPFCLGAMLAWRTTGTFNWPVFLWATLAVVLIMLSTYLAGEFSDLEEDRLSAQMERNRFTGGSQAVVQGLVPRHHPRVGSYVALALAGAIGVLLQFGYHTGPWTIPLGMTGMLFGFFYSTEPLRWVKRGIGEIIIGFSYGWLPIAVSFYLQTGHFSPLVHWMSLPVALSIFNVILINEFPDHPADLRQGKKNLTVRFGKKTASLVYAAASLAGVLLSPLAVTAGLSPNSLIFLLPVAVLSILAAMGMLTGKHADRAVLEKMCGLTIAVNLLYAAAYMASLMVWGL